MRNGELYRQTNVRSDGLSQGARAIANGATVSLLDTAGCDESELAGGACNSFGACIGQSHEVRRGGGL